MAKWRVVRYAADAFRELVAAHSLDALEDVERSLYAVYFEEYFAKLGVQTIVAELDYVDRDFLEDFAAYYVRCFHPYRRTCVRLHFFNAAFGETEFIRVLDGDVAVGKTLQNAYVGFVVVRPIPRYVIGRTCLGTYPTEGQRNFPIAHEYRASLFGLSLSVRTLPFQNQDRVVAACATSALWSAFHGTGALFHHRTPSPVEITKKATAHHAEDTRAIPSSGLTTAQMADAIRACDLEPLMVRASTAAELRCAVRAYLLGGIPIVLVGGVYARTDPTKELGVHAVVVAGFGDAGSVCPSATFALEADSMSKIYCHDDRVGPFARMEFLVDDEHGTSLSTSTGPTNDDIGSRVFRPEGMLLPLYHKIRITHSHVLGCIRSFSDYLSWLRDVGAAVPAIVWDLRLANVNEYKRGCLTDAALGTSRRELLESPMPRFIWLARGRTVSGATIDLLFDATGIEASNLCFACVDRATGLKEILQELGTAGHEQFEGVPGIVTMMVR